MLGTHQNREWRECHESVGYTALAIEKRAMKKAM